MDTADIDKVSPSSHLEDEEQHAERALAEGPRDAERQVHLHATRIQ